MSRALEFDPKQPIFRGLVTRGRCEIATIRYQDYADAFVVAASSDADAQGAFHFSIVVAF